MTDTTFFQFEAGGFPDGTPRPLNSISVQVGTFTMSATGQPLPTTQDLRIVPQDSLADRDRARIIPGTRIVEVADPTIGNGLLVRGDFTQIDAPTKQLINDQVREHKQDTEIAEALASQAAQQEGTAEPVRYVQVPENATVPAEAPIDPATTIPVPEQGPTIQSEEA